MAKSRPSATRNAASKRGISTNRDVFALVSELEEPLDRALAFAGSLALMGYGLTSIADEHGTAILAVAEALAGELETAKIAWRRIATAAGRAKSRGVPGRRDRPA